MTIAPIVRTVRVKAPPARAFDIFASQMGRWWPTGKTIASKPHVEIVLEPRPGGAWFERDADGEETHWGKVIAWDPPRRMLLGWQINSGWRHDATVQTEVELTFAPDGAGALVTLEHRDLERFGADADKMAGLLGNGWPGFLHAYAGLAGAHVQQGEGS